MEEVKSSSIIRLWHFIILKRLRSRLLHWWEMMKNVIKMTIEYLIRHLKLNSLSVKLVDILFKDQINEKYTGAKELLRSVYAPADFVGIKHQRKIRRQYNLQIIVPMYNVKRYIGQCLDSILQQNTSYSFCVFVVDDGSTDGSMEYVKNRYQDSRIILISKSNEGTASARNLAIEEIFADYVMFVDADDKLKQGAISNLLDVAYRKNADVVEGGYEVFKKKVISTHCHYDDIVSEPCGYLWGFSWAKVFRSDLFSDFSFPDKYWYEDTFISYLIYTKCKTAVTIKNVIYSYRSNFRGMSHIRKQDNKKILDAFWIINLVIEEMIKRNVPFSQSVYEQLLVSMLTSSKRMLCLDTELKKCILSAYSEILDIYFKGFQSKS